MNGTKFKSKMKKTHNCYFCSRIMLNAVDCVEKAATAACGKEAAEHQVKKEKLYIQPLADEIHCDIYPGKRWIKMLSFLVKEKNTTEFKSSYKRNTSTIISSTVEVSNLGICSNQVQMHWNLWGVSHLILAKLVNCNQILGHVADQDYIEFID